MITAPDLSSFIREITAQALMLAERIESPYAGVPLERTQLEERLDLWGQALYSDNPRMALEAYHAWNGIDPAAAERAVSPVTLPTDAPLPAWSQFLADALSVTAGEVSTIMWEFADRDPLPFYELWLRFIVVVRRQLAASSPGGWALLSENARRDVGYTLLKRIANSAAETVYTEFDLVRSRQLGALAAFVKPGAAYRYRAFVQQMAEADPIPVFGLIKKYPVLARLIANRSQLWAQMQSEFLARLVADWTELVKLFANGRDPGLVSRISAGNSDFHRGGRSTITVTFDSGLTLVYKPKPMGIEAAFNRFLDWLNTNGAPVDMKTLTILDRGDYGWAEFAAHDPIEDQAGAERYYQRIGTLACLLYVLLGTDCHCENLIASGEYPVAVDNETLFSHAIFMVENAQRTAYTSVNQLLRESVLTSLLLPQWTVDGETPLATPIAFDLSGIGALEDQPTPSMATRWRDVNTDRMKPYQEQGRIKPDANIPLIGQGNGSPDGHKHGQQNGHRIARPEDHIEDILSGFSRMYRYFITRRDVFTAPDGPLMYFRGQAVRHIVRNSNVYSTVLASVHHPAYFKDGLTYSLPFEALALDYLSNEADPSLAVAFRAERAALMRGDLPLFTAQTDSAALFTDSGVCVSETYFERSVFNQVIDRLNGLDERDLRWQSRLIRASIHSRITTGDHDQAGSDQTQDTDNPIHGVSIEALSPAVSITEFITEATTLYQALESDVIYGADGGATWIAPSVREATGRYALAPVGLSLYSGQAGIALFLAAGAALNISAGASALCLAALHPIREVLQAATFEVKQIGIGGGFGLGAWLYVLARCGHYLNDSALLEEAHRAALLLTPEHIHADTQFDILNGAAGTIPGLLAIYETSHDPRVLALARVCGQHLIDQRHASSSGLRAWDTLNDGTMWVGFSHGAAGIAYALSRLYSVTGDSALKEAAQEAIDYEARHFDPAVENWPRVIPPRVLEKEGNRIQHVWSSWCHGAPGIGLTRAAIARWIDDPKIRPQIQRDIDAALLTTQRVLSGQFSPGSLLCCGDMGRVECLFTIARLTGRDDLVEVARDHAGRLVRQARQSGSYRFSNELSRVFPAPGLFTGLAGIGYELLRLAAPDRISSPLLWE